MIRYEERSKTCRWWLKHTSSRKEEGLGRSIERTNGRRERRSMKVANYIMRNMESILWCSVFVLCFNTNYIYSTPFYSILIYFLYFILFCQIYSILIHSIPSCDFCLLLDIVILSVQEVFSKWRKKNITFFQIA